MKLNQNDLTAIRHQLISASSSIEDAACRAAGDEGFQERLRDLRNGVRTELRYLDMIAPVRIERPAAGRAQ